MRSEMAPPREGQDLFHDVRHAHLNVFSVSWALRNALLGSAHDPLKDLLHGAWHRHIDVSLCDALEKALGSLLFHDLARAPPSHHRTISATQPLKSPRRPDLTSTISLALVSATTRSSRTCCM